MSEQSDTAGSYGPGTGNLPPTRRRRRRLLGIIAALIAILLIILLPFFPRPAATVTLTPASKTLNNSLMILVAARMLSSAQQGSQTGATKPGMPAKGMSTFKNWNPYKMTIPKSTAVTDVTGQQVVTDRDVLVPPDPITPGIASVSAHAVKDGKSGNIQAMSINKSCCFPGIDVLNESAFSGGVDDSSVQQSDIDSVAKPLVTSLTQKGQSDIQSQLKSGEQLVNATPPCSPPIVASNPGVGAIAASGPWEYQFSAAQKLDMAQHIMGATIGEAKARLLQQTGVADASITVSGPIFNLVGNRITDDLERITING